MSTESPAPDELDRQRCTDLLAGIRYGRVIFIERSLPVIVPVRFLLDDGIVIDAGVDPRLSRLPECTVVAFEGDDADLAGGSAWSVTVTGWARTISDADEIRRLTAASGEGWRSGNGERLLRIDPCTVVGRTFPFGGAGRPGSAPILRTSAPAAVGRAGRE